MVCMGQSQSITTCCHTSQLAPAGHLLCTSWQPPFKHCGRAAYIMYDTADSGLTSVVDANASPQAAHQWVVLNVQPACGRCGSRDLSTAVGL